MQERIREARLRTVHGSQQGGQPSRMKVDSSYAFFHLVSLGYLVSADHIHPHGLSGSEDDGDESTSYPSLAHRTRMQADDSTGV
jgi:hypothetical protein